MRLTKKQKKRLIMRLRAVIIVFLLGIFVAMLITNLHKNKNSSLVSMPDMVENHNDNPFEALNVFASKITNNPSGLYTLINKEHTLDSEYVPNDLMVPNVNLVGHDYEERSKVRSVMVSNLEKLFYDAKAQGFDLFLLCGYRSYNTQISLYNQDIMTSGKNFSDSVAKAGDSEHQSGLAVDITIRDLDFQLSQDFRDTAEGTWLAENAHKYGFVIRYPKDKEHITGYIYEPWHLRYIGDVDLATYCYENNLTLEEVYSKLGM